MKSGDAVIEGQHLRKEEVGVDGWVNRTSHFNTGDCFLFPTDSQSCFVVAGGVTGWEVSGGLSTIYRLSLLRHKH